MALTTDWSRRRADLDLRVNSNATDGTGTG